MCIRDSALSMWNFSLPSKRWEPVVTPPGDIDFATCSARAIDDDIFIAWPDATGLTFLLSTTTGEMQWRQRLDFPASWIDQTVVNLVEIEDLLFDDEQLIVDLCVSVGDNAKCMHHLLTFDYQSLGPASDWTVSYTGAVQHSPLYVGLTSTDFSGAGLDDSAIELVEVSGEIWRIERQSRFTEHGAVWAAAPLDEAPVFVSQGPVSYTHLTLPTTPYV